MMRKPVITATQAAEMVKEGMTVHVGGFLGCGSPDRIIAALAEKGTKGLILVTNDPAISSVESGKSTGVAALVANKQFSRMVMSYIGTDPETQRQMNSGETEVDLVPQGTLAERIRAAGYGIGGFLTATGIGTEVELGKQKIDIDGKPFILEKPLPGDIALIKAQKGDRAGNLRYTKTAQNFNPLMATACAVVIAEVDELVEIGEIDPDDVHTSAIFVDYIVLAQD